jgi:hypothetical protein
VTSPVEAAALARLRDPATIRARCADVFAAAQSGATAHFALDLSRLPWCADLVARTTREAYPAGDVPFHARWRHFVVAGEDRWAPLARTLGARGRDARLRAAFELAIVSVLLDAGAGASWRYRDARGATLARSEGLAIASLDMFAAGAFSSDKGDRLRADAAGLARVDAALLARGFQAGDANPLVGLEGRAALLRRLGAAIAARPDLFGAERRLGGLADLLVARAADGRLRAAAILAAVLEALGPVWPAREAIAGIGLGDVGRHPAAGGEGPDAGLVPFHKLSQWLSYSLIEPLQDHGLAVDDLDALTGLPEYRNGGLFLDAGVLVPRHAAVLAEAHDATSELVVEWRALTVCLLDRLAEAMRAELGLDARALPLARVLEGGSWTAGRRLARERRLDGRPPIMVISDGTVF